MDATGATPGNWRAMMATQAAPAVSMTPPAISNQDTCDALNAMQAGKTHDPANHQHDMSLLPYEQAKSWVESGYFIVRGVVSPEACAEMSRVIIDLFSNTEATGKSLAGHHLSDDGLVAVEEAARIDSGEGADLRMSKLFNIHRKEPFKAFAKNPVVVNAMHAILGPDVSIFNSQYIFKNPGVWGQPWHQDSLYYTFDKMPQVGVWLATSRATVENGCLFVAPGSHLEPVHKVIPDRRPGSNYGYLEIVDYDFSRAEEVLMEAGDVLIFHSFLMHMSNDNSSNDRRSALVYHYAASDTNVLGEKSKTIDFMPV